MEGVVEASWLALEILMTFFRPVAPRSTKIEKKSNFQYRERHHRTFTIRLPLLRGGNSMQQIRGSRQAPTRVQHLMRHRQHVDHRFTYIAFIPFFLMQDARAGSPLCGTPAGWSLWRPPPAPHLAIELSGACVKGGRVETNGRIQSESSEKFGRGCLPW
jgi:hypothetical protein